MKTILSSHSKNKNTIYKISLIYILGSISILSCKKDDIEPGIHGTKISKIIHQYEEGYNYPNPSTVEVIYNSKGLVEHYIATDVHQGDNYTYTDSMNLFYDIQNRLSKVEVKNLWEETFQYDSHGRLSFASQITKYHNNNFPKHLAFYYKGDQIDYIKVTGYSATRFDSIQFEYDTRGNVIKQSKYSFNPGNYTPVYYEIVETSFDDKKSPLMKLGSPLNPSLFFNFGYIHYAYSYIYGDFNFISFLSPNNVISSKITRPPSGRQTNNTLTNRFEYNYNKYGYPKELKESVRSFLTHKFEYLPQ